MVPSQLPWRHHSLTSYSFLTLYCQLTYQLLRLSNSHLSFIHLCYCLEDIYRLIVFPLSSLFSKLLGSPAFLFGLPVCLIFWVTDGSCLQYLNRVWVKGEETISEFLCEITELPISNLFFSIPAEADVNLTW